MPFSRFFESFEDIMDCRWWNSLQFCIENENSEWVQKLLDYLSTQLIKCWRTLPQHFLWLNESFRMLLPYPVMTLLPVSPYLVECYRCFEQLFLVPFLLLPQSWLCQKGLPYYYLFTFYSSVSIFFFVRCSK